MGKIISSEIRGEEVIFTVSMNLDEALHLKGHVDNIHLITENNNHKKTNIACRGKNSATKYFLIPRELRLGLDYTEDVSCQRIDTKTKTLFLYIVEKLGL